MNIEKLIDVKRQLKLAMKSKHETEQEIFNLQHDLRTFNLKIEELQQEATTIFNEFLQGGEQDGTNS